MRIKDKCWSLVIRVFITKRNCELAEIAKSTNYFRASEQLVSALWCFCEQVLVWQHLKYRMYILYLLSIGRSVKLCIISYTISSYLLYGNITIYIVLH